MADDPWVLTANVLTHRKVPFGPRTKTPSASVTGSRQDRMDEPVVITLPVAAPRIVLVADGMGGHVAGRPCEPSHRRAPSSRARRDVTEATELARPLAAGECERSTTPWGEPALVGMGTTVAGLLIAPPRCFAFNVGDSRVYVERSGLS
jgi:serine/threonine protein phosphatase PrpC